MSSNYLVIPQNNQISNLLLLLSLFFLVSEISQVLSLPILLLTKNLLSNGLSDCETVNFFRRSSDKRSWLAIVRNGDRFRAVARLLSIAVYLTFESDLKKPAGLVFNPGISTSTKTAILLHFMRIFKSPLQGLCPISIFDVTMKHSPASALKTPREVEVRAVLAVETLHHEIVEGDGTDPLPIFQVQ
jgi:hypothetical protein